MRGKKSASAAVRRAQITEVELNKVQQEFEKAQVSWGLQRTSFNIQMTDLRNQLRDAVGDLAAEAITQAQEETRRVAAEQRTEYERRAEAALTFIYDNGREHPLTATQMVELAKILGIDCGPIALAAAEVELGGLNRRMRRGATTKNMAKGLDEIRQGKHQQTMAAVKRLTYERYVSDDKES